MLYIQVLNEYHDLAETLRVYTAGGSPSTQTPASRCHGTTVSARMEPLQYNDNDIVIIDPGPPDDRLQYNII